MNTRWKTLTLVFCQLLLAMACKAMPSAESPRLPTLSFESTPYDFTYTPSKMRVLTYYPAKLKARKNSLFNIRILKLGICPVNLVSLINKDWFAPRKMVIKEMRKQVEASVDPTCTVSEDVDHRVKKILMISDEPTVLVLDKNGYVVHRFEGVLSEEEQQFVIDIVQPETPSTLVIQAAATEPQKPTVRNTRGPSN
ncbi:Uncharacterised protein [BD1-7 clade bacterium]|uniref:Uncharacterized protein n=1 Tax=BD1-7 clade bacterium TaxID=2029982 RepID=A0A5S9QGL9_9GAMM|nr:Uncharacterised protein [BD1-7 clade bacterium]CAA0116535.1 Uncharacterised protein [BD1-7 clade bacterium]CAA0120161.1 Uncharacterised protein [BD1-7 clade bacterium]